MPDFVGVNWNRAFFCEEFGYRCLPACDAARNPNDGAAVGGFCVFMLKEWFFSCSVARGPVPRACWGARKHGEGQALALRTANIFHQRIIVRIHQFHSIKR